MEGTYGVYFGDQPVGKVQVLRRGLYYRFSCRCRLSGAVVCRLHIRWGAESRSLGVVVPMGDGFGLDTSLAIKHCGTGAPEFFLKPKGEPMERKLVPLCPQEPFSYISRLKDAYLVQKDGVTMVSLPGETELTADN